MPTSIAVAAVVAGISGTVAASIAAGTLVFGFSMAAFGTSLVLGGLSMALAKSKSQPGASGGVLGRLVTLRQPISYWQIIYGRRRVPGVITFMETTPDVRTIETPVYDETGNITGTTTTTQVAAENQFLQLVVTWAGHPCQEIEEIHFDDQVAWTSASGLASRWVGVVEIINSLGAEASTVQPFPALVGRSAGKWTNEHRQSGRCKSYILLSWHQDKFANGIPNITAVIKGYNEIYDPRTATRGYSANPALCTASYLENASFGLGATLADEINQDQLTAAANDCDDAVALAAGGTESRYELHTSFILSEEPGDVLERFANSMAGRIVHSSDTWQIFAGVYQAPTLELDESDLAGPIKLQNLVSMRDNANGVKGTYCEPSAQWQPTDFPAVASATYLAEDNDVRRWREIALEATEVSGSRAQRLAKIELLRTRQPITFSAPFKLSALRAIAGGTVAISNARYGWSSKAFEVTSFAFAIGEGNQLQVNLGLRETAATVYDWASSEEQAVDAAPNTNLPDPFTIGAPGQPTIQETTYQTRAGAGVKAQILVSWAPASDARVEDYQMRYRLASATADDTSYIYLAPTPNYYEVLRDVAPETYVFEVRSISSLGARSAWQATTSEIRGLGAAPADIAGISLQAAGGLAVLRWDPVADADVQEGGHIEFRHSPLASAIAVWEESFSIGERINGRVNQAALPLKDGTYLAKAVDSSGISSLNAAKIGTKQASVHNFVDISVITEDPSFAGTHSGTVATDSLLKLAGVSLFDAIADLDAVPALDSEGGVTLSGTYSFSVGLDLGSVQAVRLTSELAGIITNVNDNVDNRTETVDDWQDFDGTAGAAADAYVEVRATDDDPASSPTWEDWKRLDAAEYVARAFEFRAQLETRDAAYNVNLTQLRVAAAQIY